MSVAPSETVEKYTRETDGYVEHVRIRRTDDAQYPCGYDYTLYYGTKDGKTLLRYDNAHEQSKGHERHTGDEVTEVAFPGIVELFDRFQREIDEFPP